MKMTGIFFLGVETTGFGVRVFRTKRKKTNKCRHTALEYGVPKGSNKA